MCGQGKVRTGAELVKVLQTDGHFLDVAGGHGAQRQPVWLPTAGWVRQGAWEWEQVQDGVTRKPKDKNGLGTVTHWGLSVFITGADLKWALR